MYDLNQPAYAETLRMPKAGDNVFIQFKGQPLRSERLVELLNEGGEGSIFSTENYGSMVVKLYRPDHLTRGRTEKIKILAEEIEDVNGKVFDYICWPKATVYDHNQDGHMIGYLMERAPADAQPLDDLISNLVLENNPKGYDRWDLADFCHRIAQRFGLLHTLAQERLLMCDVNPNNILIASSDKQIYFVDLDSYQYESKSGMRLRCPVGRAEYTSPELFERLKKTGTSNYANVDRTREDERFAVAVLYFYILMLGQGPFERQGESNEAVIRTGAFRYRNGCRTCPEWNNLTPTLQQMFRGVFMNRKYYTDRQWVEAFAQLKSAIEDQKVSRLLRPEEGPMSETDRMVALRCRRCNREFIGSKQRYEQHYPYCLSCFRRVYKQEEICRRVICNRCGQQFAVNAADEQVAKDWKPVCPDCDPGFYHMRKSNFADYKDDAPVLLQKAILNFERR